MPGSNFDAACGILDYLRDLGISHVYCSPCLQAVAGSTHGYDVDEDERWLVLRRGRISVACNFAETTRGVGAPRRRVLLCSHPASSYCADTLRLAPGSVMIVEAG